MEKGECKTEVSTLYTEDEKNNCSKLRLVSSQYLTVQMAINYLYQWRNDQKLVIVLLQRLYQFFINGSYYKIPWVIFIMSLNPLSEFSELINKLANYRLPFYLILVWSFNTYNGNERILIRQKIDSCLIKRFKQCDLEGLSDEQINNKVFYKQKLSNYLSAINDFFERLFSVPEKLKQIDKLSRNSKLHYYLKKAFKSFTGDKHNYIQGVIFPIQQSSVVTSILYEQCKTFSTKDRVPFKFVVEMISFEEAEARVNNNKFNNKVDNNNQSIDEQSNKNQSTHYWQQELLLPQTYFGELWKTTFQKIASKSQYRECPSYTIRSFIVKSGDDFKQEYLAMQLIKLIHSIVQVQNLKVWIQPYMVIPYNGECGLIEFINDTQTVSYLKQVSRERSLRKIYKQIFGSNEDAALTNFTQSLAGYSILQYLFQVKDRHNKNILIDSQGHIIHIDFSFMISSSPGNMGFQQAPFKLTQDYMDIMQVIDSDLFIYFKSLFTFGLKYIRKYKKQIMQMIMMMKNSQLQYFRNFDQNALDKRFHLSATDKQLEKMHTVHILLHNMIHINGIPILFTLDPLYLVLQSLMEWGIHWKIVQKGISWDQFQLIIVTKVLQSINSADPLNQSASRISQQLEKNLGFGKWQTFLIRGEFAKKFVSTEAYYIILESSQLKAVIWLNDFAIKP